MVRIKVKFSEG